MEVNLKEKYYNVYKNIRELQDRFEEGSKSDPADPQAGVRIELADQYLQVGEVDNAVTIMRDYINGWVNEHNILKDPLSIRFFMASMIALHEKERTVEALELLDVMSDLLAKAGDEAILGLKQAAEANVTILKVILKTPVAPKDKTGQEKPGVTAGMLDSINAVEAFREKNADRMPTDFMVSILIYYGEYHYALGNMDRALDKWNEAAELASGSNLEFRAYGIYNRISARYEQLGEYSEALEYYDRYRVGMEKLWAAKEYAYSTFLIERYGNRRGAEQMRSMEQKNQDLGEKILHDALTGLYNRRFLKRLYEETFVPDAGGNVRVKSEGFSVPQQDNRDGGEHLWCAVMLDIDYFKEYNDNYGHLKGDRVISTIGEILRGHADEMTYPIRYGGEEFLILTRNRSEAETEILARTILKELKERKLIHTYSKVGRRVTMSAGVASLRCESSSDITRMCEDADKALYISKHDGRNRCSTYRRNED